MCRGFVVDGHEVLPAVRAAVAEFGARAAGLDDSHADPE
jgi:hypothetical protein